MDWYYFKEMQQILDYMEQHLREKISVEEIARAVGYSPWHCNRLFKAYFGESMASYLRQLRMDAAKGALKESGSVERVAKALSFHSPEGFSRAFQAQFGITPSRYLQGGEAKEKFLKIYEYRATPDTWGTGVNPTADGLWEFGYYDLLTEEYGLMEWDGGQFVAPFHAPIVQDTRWYCRHRMDGYGMHPGRMTQSVRVFCCPHSGEIEAFFSVGRIAKVNATGNPCSVQLFHNETPLSPVDGAAVLDNTEAVFLTGTCSVRAGDRISLHLDAMGDSGRDGVFLYRQRIGYLTVTDD